MASEYDGELLRIKNLSDVKVGMVLRDINPDGTSPPFSDMVVYKITYSRNAWESWTHFHLAWPHVLSYKGMPLVSVKTSDTLSLDYKRIVLNSKGEPYMMKID